MVCGVNSPRVSGMGKVDKTVQRRKIVGALDHEKIRAIYIYYGQGVCIVSTMFLFLIMEKLKMFKC